MVRHDPQRDVTRFAAAIAQTEDGFALSHDRGEKVGFEVGRDPLHDGGKPFQTEASVDIFTGQGGQVAFFVLIELGEDEIVELQETAAIATGRAAPRVRAARFGPHIVKNLRIRAARSRGSGGPPKVVLFPQSGDLSGWETDMVKPKIISFLVFSIYGNVYLFLRQLQDVDDELPSPLDRLAFEVVPEGEVPEHLKERVVARGAADLFDIVGSDALLASRDTRVSRFHLSPEDRFERNHPGNREEQLGVFRNQRSAG